MYKRQVHNVPVDCDVGEQVLRGVGLVPEIEVLGGLVLVDHGDDGVLLGAASVSVWGLAVDDAEAVWGGVEEPLGGGADGEELGAGDGDKVGAGEGGVVLVQVHQGVVGQLGALLQQEQLALGVELLDNLADRSTLLFNS